MILKYNFFIKRILTIIFSVSVAILLVFGPLLYYSFSIDFYKANISSKSNIPQEVIIGGVQNIYNFLLGKNEINIALLSTEEKTHLEDVKIIFNKVQILAIISIIMLLITSGLFFYLRKRYIIIKGLLIGAIIIIGLDSLTISTFIFDFQGIFTIFHKIFFPQGNWSFDESSVLIQLFPFSFFQDITKNIFITSAAISLFIIICIFFYKKYQNKINKTN